MDSVQGGRYQLGTLIKPTRTNVSYRIEESWEEISKDTILNSWRHIGIGWQEVTNETIHAVDNLRESSGLDENGDRVNDSGSEEE